MGGCVLQHIAHHLQQPLRIAEDHYRLLDVSTDGMLRRLARYHRNRILNEDIEPERRVGNHLGCICLRKQQ
jgi:hypothetical protein